MIVLWCAAAVLVAGYFRVGAVAAMLEPFRRFHEGHGAVAAFVGQMFFCGVLPSVFLLAMKSIRPRRPLLTVIVQGAWCGMWGIACNALFGAMAAVLGDGRDLATLLAKMAIDQFVWTVFFIAPANALFFFWLGRDFSWTRVRAELPRRLYRELVMPNLLANWCVWIPVSMIVFAFPLDLQIHVNGLACAFWVLVCLQIGRRTSAP